MCYLLVKKSTTDQYYYICVISHFELIITILWYQLYVSESSHIYYICIIIVILHSGPHILLSLIFCASDLHFLYPKRICTQNLDQSARQLTMVTTHEFFIFRFFSVVFSKLPSLIHSCSAHLPRCAFSNQHCQPLLYL